MLDISGNARFSMTFKDWLVLRGLSASTAEKYAGAVAGPLSDWAMEHGILAGPLLAIESPAKYETVSAKLSELPIFRERNERGHHMYSAALARFEGYLREYSLNDVEADVAQVLTDPATTATEKLELVKARIGQGNFREQLIRRWEGCAVTGYQDVSLLIASHIKPWSVSNNHERVDPANGLLLLPNLDRAFDKGLLTFAASGELQVSPLLSRPQQLGIAPGMSARLGPEHQKYMEFHRAVVYRAK
jgi:hypothetical protein